MKKATTTQLVDDVLNAINAVRGCGAGEKNPVRAAMYWRIGKQIRDALGKDTSPEKTTTIIDALSEGITTEHGDEFTSDALRRMVQFSQRFEYETVVTLSSKLDWSHFDELIDIDALPYSIHD